MIRTDTALLYFEQVLMSTSKLGEVGVEGLPIHRGESPAFFLEKGEGFISG